MVVPMSHKDQERTFRYVPIDQIYHHPENPRSKSRYEENDPQFRRTYQDMESGWDYDHPASLISNDDGRYPQFPAGSFRTLVGNRRLAVARKRGIQSIPAIIVRDLSRDEELRRLHDHAGVVGLSDAEKFDAFKSLLTTGLTPENICIRLGWFTRKNQPNRNEYNKFRLVASAPKPDQEAWKKYQNGNRTMDLLPTGENLTALVDATAKDTATGHVGPPEDGPIYTKVREELIKKATKPPVNYARKEAMETAAIGLSDFPALKLLFNTIAGVATGYTLEQVIILLQWMHQQAFGLRGAVALSKPSLAEKILGNVSLELATEVTNGPATEEPATEEPATEEPATEEPATEEPASRKPTPVRSKR